MKTLFKTDRTPARSKDMRHLGGPPAGMPAQEGVAWFEMVLHDGPPDDTTWEGCGQTVAYWRENFARLRDPHSWTVQAHGIEGVAPAVIPDKIVQGLPEDARISFVWTFIPAELANKS